MVVAMINQSPELLMGVVYLGTLILILIIWLQQVKKTNKPEIKIPESSCDKNKSCAKRGWLKLSSTPTTSTINSLIFGIETSDVWYYAVLGDKNIYLFKTSECQTLVSVLDLEKYGVLICTNQLSKGLAKSHLPYIKLTFKPNKQSLDFPISNKPHYNPRPLKATRGFAPAKTCSLEYVQMASDLGGTWLPEYYLFVKKQTELESWYKAIASRCNLPECRQFKVSENNHLVKLVKLNYEPWYNVFYNRFRLGLSDKNFFQRALEFTLKSWLRTVNNHWISFKIAKISSSLHLPSTLDLATVSSLNDQNQLVIKIPIQNDDTLLSFQLHTYILPGFFNQAHSFEKTILSSIFRKALPSVDISFFQTNYASINVSLLKKDNEPFQADMQLEFSDLTNRNCCIAFLSLSKLSQLKIDITLGSSTISISSWIIQAFFHFFEKISVYISEQSIPFFYQHLVRAFESFGYLNQTLPAAIQNISQYHNLITTKQTDSFQIRVFPETKVISYSIRNNVVAPSLRAQCLSPTTTRFHLQFFTNLRGACQLLNSSIHQKPRRQTLASSVSSGRYLNGFVDGLSLVFNKNQLEALSLTHFRSKIPLFGSVNLSLVPAAPPKFSPQTAICFSSASQNKPRPNVKNGLEKKRSAPLLKSFQILKALESKLNQPSAPSLNSGQSRKALVDRNSSLFSLIGSKNSKSSSGPIRCRRGWFVSSNSSFSSTKLSLATVSSTLSYPNRSSS